MKRLKIIAFAAVCLALSASLAWAEETRTVDWYAAPENSKALEEKLNECRNNPGELENTPNCKNAKAAYQRIFKSGKFEKVKEPRYGF